VAGPWFADSEVAESQVVTDTIEDMWNLKDGDEVNHDDAWSVGMSEEQEPQKEIEK